MIELVAAVVGAAFGVAATGVTGLVKRDNDASVAQARLTAAVEHIAGEVSQLRTDLREDRAELYPRISSIEQRLASLEAKL